MNKANAAKEDFKCMKETLRIEDKNRMSSEFFEFHDKVNKILED